jgi:hypothetical protein
LHSVEPDIIFHTLLAMKFIYYRYRSTVTNLITLYVSQSYNVPFSILHQLSSIYLIPSSIWLNHLVLEHPQIPFHWVLIVVPFSESLFNPFFLYWQVIVIVSLLTVRKFWIPVSYLKILFLILSSLLLSLVLSKIVMSVAWILFIRIQDSALNVSIFLNYTS